MQNPTLNDFVHQCAATMFEDDVDTYANLESMVRQSVEAILVTQIPFIRLPGGWQLTRSDHRLEEAVVWKLDKRMVTLSIFDDEPELNKLH